MRRTFLRLATVAMLSAATLSMSSCSKGSDDTGQGGNPAELKAYVEEVTKSLNSLQTVVEALESGAVVSEVVKSATGYTIIFSDATTVLIETGTDASVFGIQEIDGVYYWTITSNEETTLLTDNAGNNIQVSSADDDESLVPSIDSEGYWVIDGERILDADNKPVKAHSSEGDSIFSDIIETEQYVEFVLADGTSIIIPKEVHYTFEIVGIDTTETNTFGYGTTTEFDIVSSGVSEWAVTYKVIGWNVSYSVINSKLYLTAPAESEEASEMIGDIVITIVTELDGTRSYKFTVAPVKAN